MFFLQFDATPRRSHPYADEIAGAIVRCWIQETTLAKAEATALKEITDLRWIVGELDEGYAVSRSTYHDEENLGYFDQALIDKRLYVFRCYQL